MSHHEKLAYNRKSFDIPKMDSLGSVKLPEFNDFPPTLFLADPIVSAGLLLSLIQNFEMFREESKRDRSLISRFVQSKGSVN